MFKKPSTISIVIMTKNEAEDIPACIDSALWANEVIILDCGSTDNTLEVCKKYAVTVVNTDWPGFGEQSNRALNIISSDWCLLVDADERIPEKLKQEILSTINSNPVHAVYKLPRLNFFMGQAMWHSLNPKGDLPVKLLRKGLVRFQYEVHPEPVINGSTGKLTNCLLHYPFKNLAELLDKANYYSSLCVAKLEAKNVTPGITKTLFHASWAFFKIYFLNLGFLDGWPGFVVAFSNFEGVFYKYAKLLEKVRAKTSS
jgi:glycosyltransferase involved in cell wall biosynthesis